MSMQINSMVIQQLLLMVSSKCLLLLPEAIKEKASPQASYPPLNNISKDLVAHKTF